MTDPATSTVSDAEIIKQVLNGDTNAFEHLLKKYQNHVLKIIKKHVPYERVEETAQEAFVRTYQSLKGFKKAGSFKQWLSAIAVRTCYDFWRKQYRSREVSMSDLSEEHQAWLNKAVSDKSDESWQEKGRQQEARELLDWALSKLSAEDRIVLELVYLEDRTVKEAADLLGWSTTNVKVRAFRSRKKIQKLLLKNRGHIGK